MVERIACRAILYFLGMMNRATDSYGKLLANKEGRTETCLLIIEDQPEIRESTYKAIARVTGIRDSVCWQKVNFKVLLYFQKDSLAAALHSGSGITVRLRFQSVSFPGNPGEFNYRKYLANRGIFLQGYLHSHAWLPAGCGKKMVLKTTAYRMRDVLLKKLGNLHLDRSEYGLLSALTLGYKNDLTPIRHIFHRLGNACYGAVGSMLAYWLYCWAVLGILTVPGRKNCQNR
jgi:competence protein ComEC